jgi:hypothetical protein
VKTLFLNKKKKGMSPVGAFVSIVLAIALIAVIIGVFFPSIIQAGQEMPKMVSCTSSIGGKQGVCIPTSQYCDQKISFGCQTGQTCCFDENVVRAAYVGKYCQCEANGNILGVQDLGTTDACRSRCIGGATREFCKKEIPQGATPLLSCVSDLAVSGRVACLDNVQNLRSCLPLLDCAKDGNCVFCQNDAERCK